MSVDVALMVYSLRGGRVERMRLPLTEAFDRRGCRTAILVVGADDPCRSFRGAPRVRLIDLKAASRTAWLVALASHLRAEGPRVLLATIEIAGLLALWLRRKTLNKVRWSATPDRMLWDDS